MRRLHYWVPGAACGLLLTASPATAAVTTEAVLSSPAYEVEPYVGGGYFAWSQASEAQPNHFNAYARPDGGSRFKVNPAGTVGFASDVDGTKFVYGQAPRPGHAAT